MKDVIQTIAYLTVHKSLMVPFCVLVSLVLIFHPLEAKVQLRLPLILRLPFDTQQCYPARCTARILGNKFLQPLPEM